MFSKVSTMGWGSAAWDMASNALRQLDDVRSDIRSAEQKIDFFGNDMRGMGMDVKEIRKISEMVEKEKAKDRGEIRRILAEAEKEKTKCREEAQNMMDGFMKKIEDEQNIENAKNDAMFAAFEFTMKRMQNKYKYEQRTEKAKNDTKLREIEFAMKEMMEMQKKTDEKKQPRLLHICVCLSGLSIFLAIVLDLRK